MSFVSFVQSFFKMATEVESQIACETASPVDTKDEAAATELGEKTAEESPAVNCNSTSVDGTCTSPVQEPAKEQNNSDGKSKSTFCLPGQKLHCILAELIVANLRLFTHLSLADLTLFAANTTSEPAVATGEQSTQVTSTGEAAETDKDVAAGGAAAAAADDQEAAKGEPCAQEADPAAAADKDQDKPDDAEHLPKQGGEKRVRDDDDESQPAAAAEPTAKMAKAAE